MDVKICGMTNRDDVLWALEAGADYIGFVLYAQSPRGIRALEMARILDRLDVPCCAVAVCVNMPWAEVVCLAADCPLHAVQLHGEEAADACRTAGPTIWRAVKLIDGTVIPAVEGWKAERYVVDAAVPGLYGGTGRTVDWEQAREFAAGFPAMLAGGLTPGNVADAVRAVRPMGVDVASGVERGPGRKDGAKVRAFIRNAKASVFANEESSEQGGSDVPGERR